MAIGRGSFAITGDLSVEDSPLITLEGLENLTSVGGNLSIGSLGAGNAALTSLAGLENLTSVGGYLSIFGNAALTSLAGFGGGPPQHRRGFVRQEHRPDQPDRA